jgi:DNA-binding transcriptional regulator PaaX
MGNLEKAIQKRTKRKNLQKIILGTVAAAGLLSVAVVAPNVIGAMSKLGFLPARRQKEFIRGARERLVGKGLLEWQGNFLKLTPKGRVLLARLEQNNYKIKKPKRWDGKWRVLIFDIPETLRAKREKVRLTLISIGFFRLQDSVWIYPYDCEELITLLKADFEMGKNLLYMIVEALENDRLVKKQFGLSTQ